MEAALVTVENVPVFTENEYETESGVTVFDVATLQQIVDVNNARIAIGEPPDIIIGHNKTGCDCSLNPPAVGFIDQLSLGQRNGQATIFARYQIFAEQWNLYAQYKKRSIEIKTDTLIMGAIALIGSWPKLDLGFDPNNGEDFDGGHFFSDVQSGISYFLFSEKDDGDHIHTLNRSGEKMALSDEDKKDLFAAWAETEAGKFVAGLMKAADEDNKKEDKNDELKASADEEEADAAAEEKKDEEEENKKDADKFSLLESELHVVKAKLRRSEREKELLALQSEGHFLDVAEELNDTDDLNDAQFSKHLTRIVKYSRKSPVGNRIDFSRLKTQVTNPGVPSAELCDKAMQLAEKKQIKFNEALDQLQGLK